MRVGAGPGTLLGPEETGPCSFHDVWGGWGLFFLVVGLAWYSPLVGAGGVLFVF